MSWDDTVNKNILSLMLPSVTVLFNRYLCNASLRKLDLFSEKKNDNDSDNDNYNSNTNTCVIIIIIIINNYIASKLDSTCAT